jgi:hypothetical protein
MGQAKKSRACPAAGRAISATECGGNRHSRYQCPDTCPHNPFTKENYDQMLAMEDALQGDFVKFFVGLPHIKERIEETCRDLERKKIDSATLECRMRTLFHATPFSSGLSLFEDWLSSDSGKLKNDLRVLAEGRLRMRLALLEIREVSDGFVTAIDCLEPGQPLQLIVDRSFSRSASRFQLILSVVYPTPHYIRLFGNADEVTLHDLRREPTEVFHIIARHLGYDPSQHRFDQWGIANKQEILQAYVSTERTRFRQKLESTDAGIVETIYRIQGATGLVCLRLESLDTIQKTAAPSNLNPEDVFAHYEWLAPEGDSPSIVNTNVLWGNLLILRSGILKLITISEEKNTHLQQQLVQTLRECITFESSLHQDYARQSADRIKVEHPHLVPPELLDEKSGLLVETSVRKNPGGATEDPAGSARSFQKDGLHGFYRSFVDESNPALGNHTPREAAGMEAHRPTLRRLLKQILISTDAMRRKDGLEIDVEWMFEVLDCEDLRCSPPPVSKKPKTHGKDEEDEEVEDTLDDEYWRERLYDVLNRYGQGELELFPKEGDESGLGTLQAGIVAFFDVDSPPEYLEYFISIAGLLWHLMVPEGESRNLTIERVTEELNALQEESLDFAEAGKEAEWSKQCSIEPALLPMILELLVEMMDHKKKVSDEPEEELRAGIVTIAAIINLLAGDYPLEW